VTDILVERFERYFRHADAGHDVLVRGDHAVAARNVRTALWLLDIPTDSASADEELFDDELEVSVKRFQKVFHHRVHDGAVGPGTRKLIVEGLLGRFEADIFLRLARPEGALRPSLFLSYAWRDSAKVGKLAQWLRDNGVRVILDQTDFEAGQTIPANIRRAVAEADKVVGVLSASSRDRDWPRFEAGIAEELERRLETPVLIYIRLDETPLPAHDPNRLAIDAQGKPLKRVGQEILHALTHSGLEPTRFEYDEDEPL
jgi:hypothetical protein